MSETAARMPPNLQEGYQSRSLFRLALSRFRSHRMAALGSLLLGAVFAFVVLAVGISISLGTFVGLLSGYIGAWVDSALSRMTEALLSIPPLILLLVLSSALAREMSNTVVIVVVLIGLTSWMQLSRIVRAQVYSLKEREFVPAARAIGDGLRDALDPRSVK